MGYGSKGRRPIERASKIAHVEIIKNPEVLNFLQGCELPSTPAPAAVRDGAVQLETATGAEVTAVIAVDGGYTETFVREEYPSASLTFFTFGPLFFELADLRALDSKRFIAPEDLKRLKTIERYILVLPTRGIRHREQQSLAATVRHAIYKFFDERRGPDNDQLMASLRWFLFREWNNQQAQAPPVAVEHCPSGCGHGRIAFAPDDAKVRPCPTCGCPVYLTDVFRLHERVDEEMGCSGISAYVMTMLEQLVLVHLIWSIWKIKPALLRSVLFIKDGPLAFFGLVAPLYKPMRELIEYLLGEPSGPGGPTVRIVGLEKSGPFVEHAAALHEVLEPGHFMVLGDQYIRRYVIPGGESGETYGKNTYYGQKVLFRAPTGEMHVATIPARRYLADPTASDLPYVHEILGLVAELRCSMYDNALIPVALANKLVSLSDVPSQRILSVFARRSGVA